MSASESAQRKKIATLQEQGVRYGLASYVDIHGRPKCKAVPIAHFEQMLRGSELFTGAALDGVPQEVNDDEVAAHPDFERAMILPWQPDTMWFPSDLFLNGAPFESCSRQILKRVLAQAASLGYTFNLGVETEFFLFRPTENGGFEPALKPDFLEKPAYDVRLLLNSMPVIDELVAAMNTLGWDVYSFDQEDALGQFETDFNYADALTMADRVTFFRLMAGQIAAKHGMFASFMPKPLGNRTGSGAHYNMSLASIEGGANLFLDKNDPRGCGLSQLGYHFIAGILRHAKAICAVIAPTVNSYKRLIAQGSMSGFTWAPIFMCYGNNNRTNMMRIPMAGGRVECRAADIACNFYLGAAMILAAGLEGIVEELDPGEPNTENMYLVAPDELRRRGIERLPQTLAEAVAEFEKDELSRKVMGDKMYRAFIAYKKEEWRKYHTHVSDWELKEYLRFF